jgi:hypothetical protein
MLGQTYRYILILTAHFLYKQYESAIYVHEFPSSKPCIRRNTAIITVVQVQCSLYGS